MNTFTARRAWPFLASIYDSCQLSPDSHYTQPPGFQREGRPRCLESVLGAEVLFRKRAGEEKRTERRTSRRREQPRTPHAVGYARR